MRDHYAGDLSDLLKFNLLRSLVESDRKLGIAWFYVPGEDNPLDGKHRSWQSESRWESLNKNIHATLVTLSTQSVSALEDQLSWPAGVTYYGEPVPHHSHRPAWSADKQRKLKDVQIVFLDPDNGLGDATPKHATFDEVRVLRERGQTVIFITFPKRIKHDWQVQELHRRLATEARANRILTIRISVSVPTKSGKGYVPTFRWFTLVDCDAELDRRARQFGALLQQCERVKVRIDEFAKV